MFRKGYRLLVRLIPGLALALALALPIGAHAENIEFSQDLHGGLESQGPVPNLNFALRLHMTFLADGTLTADVSSFTVTCK